MSTYIIKMSKEYSDFVSIADLQKNYFERDLPNLLQGFYMFSIGNNQPTPNKGDLLLFFYDNHIVASAKLLDLMKDYKTQEEYEELVQKEITPIKDTSLHFSFGNASDRRGAYILDKETIKTFAPISLAECNNVLSLGISGDYVNAPGSVKLLSIQNKDKLKERMTVK